MTVWRAVAALHFTGCRGVTGSATGGVFSAGGQITIVNGFDGVKRRRALNIGALVIALFDVLRQIAGGSGMR